MRWLISTILTKTANRDTDVWGLVRLDSRILRRVMNQRTALEVIQSLVDGGAIQTAPYYAGVKCKGYRLARRYLSDRCVRMPVTDPWLLERIQRERQRLDTEEREARWLPIHYALHQDQQRLTIGPDADVILAGQPPHTRLCQDVLVGNIRRRDFHLTVGRTCRVFNAITGLKRDLRHALRIDGEPLGSVDIRCAQPGLLAVILRQAYPPNRPKHALTYKLGAPGRPDPPLSLPAPPLAPFAPSLASPDVAFFGELACTGCLYERLVTLSGLTRELVKKRFLIDVLAKRGRYPSDVERAFRAEFPTVHRAIRYVNRDDHGELIRLLQRMEAWLVIEQVSPRLVGRVPVVTLHDAIYSTGDGLRAVEAAFRETFDAIGCRLALKVETP